MCYFHCHGPLTIDYEYVMPNVPSDNFRVHRIDDLAWCEIDDNNHFLRASSEVIFAVDAANDLYSSH